MSSTMMHAAHAGHAPAAATEQLSAQQAPEFTPGVRNAIIAALAFFVLLLGSIGVWLWWGMHQYQNIHPFIKGTF